MKPGKPPQRKTRPKRKGKPRFKGRKDEAFREWVRGLQCLLRRHALHRCGGQTECCHVKTRGSGGWDRGNLWPGCAWAHDIQHHMGIVSFQRKYGIDLRETAQHLLSRYLQEAGEAA